MEREHSGVGYWKAGAGAVVVLDNRQLIYMTGKIYNIKGEAKGNMCKMGDRVGRGKSKEGGWRIERH